MSRVVAFVFVVGALPLSGCGTSYEDRVEDLVELACSSAEECGNIGPDGLFESAAECRSDVDSTVRDLLPLSECDERINESRYEVCEARVPTVYCEGNLGDVLSALTECNAAQVCIGED
ncbi:MAG: DUF6184 family natural product biosynthesis lipoprotein [Myxococcota bacterium]